MKKHILLFGAIMLAVMLQARHLPSTHNVGRNGKVLESVKETQAQDQTGTQQSYDIQLPEILQEDGTLDLSKGLSGSVNLSGFQLRTRPDGAPYFVEDMAPVVGPDDNWHAFGGVSGMNNIVWSLAVIGTDVYAAGQFTIAGGVAANRIAKWNGTSWSALGTGMNNAVYALAVSGSNLYAGGSFTTAGGVAANRIAKWNGTSWSALGAGMDGDIQALAVMGTDLYAGGYFTTAGGVAANRVAKWNGTGWSALGSGMDDRVSVFAVIGSNLYAAGDFTTAGGVSANYIAKWNGTSWSALGSGMSYYVAALAVIGTDLYAGGFFTIAGGVGVGYLAKWNGTSWSGLGTGVNGTVNSLVVVGSELYVGGGFSEAGGGDASYIAKWNGSTWSSLGSGLDSYGVALTAIGTDVYVGGFFTTAGGKASAYIAQWDGSATCPSLTTAPPNVYINNSGCGFSCMQTGGDIGAPGNPCPTGSSVQYSTDNGATWSGTLPIYDQDGPAQSIRTRCQCDSDGNTVSPASTAVVTVPATCGQITCYADLDFDGYGNPNNSIVSCNSCTYGYVSNNLDCNDNSSAEKPGQVWYKDFDNDAYSDGTTLTQCLRPVGYKRPVELIGTSSDCNDASDAINPSALEICDGIDNNCNNLTDEGVQSTFYRDLDMDGFGDPGFSQLACSQPSGFVSNGLDCNDNNPIEKPLQTWYADYDNDSYSSGGIQFQCLRPLNYKVANELIATSGDCNDNNSTINPAATEVCDGLDNNCNGMTDEGVLTTYYLDQDNDGFGNPAISQQACSQPYVYYVINGTDCNDQDNTIYPGAADICDNKDNNCDGNIDEGGMGTPPGWGAGNIGGAGNATSEFDCNGGGGSASMVFNITSQGFSGAGNADLINSNYQQQCGDASITAHLVGNPAPGWAGIYIREDLVAGSKMVALKTNLSSFLRREVRSSTNGNKTTTQNPLYAGNTWLRIVRTGNVFSFYTSPNGMTWTFFGSSTVAMNSCVYLGLFAESINGATTINASFDNVVITGGAAPLVAAPDLDFEVQDEQQVLDYGLYPNPSSGVLNFDFLQFQGKAIQIEVYSLQGQLLQTAAYNEAPPVAKLDLSACQSGMYFVGIKGEGIQEVFKRVVLNSTHQ